jgi:hypothetical protein
VHEELDLLDTDARLGERLLDDLRDRLGRRFRRRQRLADGDDALVADEAEVGEGAADVDADAVQGAVSITCGVLRSSVRIGNAGGELHEAGGADRVRARMGLDVVVEAGRPSLAGPTSSNADPPTPCARSGVRSPLLPALAPRAVVQRPFFR